MTAEGRWSLPVAARDVDPRFTALLLATEDARFYVHDGDRFPPTVRPWMSVSTASLAAVPPLRQRGGQRGAGFARISVTHTGGQAANAAVRLR